MKRKIAYCLPSLYIPGGMERVLTIKANYFADQLSYEVFLILTDGKDREPYFSLSQNVKVINLDINFDELWNLPLHKKVISYLNKQREYKRKLTACLCSIRPDISVSMLRREINFINSIPDGSHKIGEIHINKDNFRDLNNEKGSGLIKRLIASLWMKQLIFNLKKLDKFVVLTEKDKEKWTELNNTVVIGNPLPFYPDNPSSCNNRKIISVGRLVPEKGFDRLIKAWGMIATRYPDWSLHIFGTGDKKEMQELIKQYKATHNCIIESPVKNIEEKYLESSIFALASRFEGFGMVICEAMACGIPAVSFDCPWGPRYIIKDKEDGFLVPDGDISAFSHQLSYLIENNEVRINMGQQARINIARLSIDHISKQWEDLFNKILSDKK